MATAAPDPQTGLFTDGGASPNPGPGAWAYAMVLDGEVLFEDAGYEPHTTNNRMELRALIEAYKAAPESFAGPVYSDSQLAVNIITQWAAGWEARGWRRKTGPVENLDLVKEVYALSRERPEIQPRWLRGHAGNRWNEYVDGLVNACRHAASGRP